MTTTKENSYGYPVTPTDPTDDNRPRKTKKTFIRRLDELTPVRKFVIPDDASQQLETIDRPTNTE
ncbi:MAG: hypothetical protein PHN45_00285 [Methylococcales bacterium]|nr:hypothetical protein [Methylococcales bacterium]